MGAHTEPSPSHDAPLSIEEEDDVCDAITRRFANSSAPQHRHLCAMAQAIRALTREEGLPLSPLSYFASSMAAISGRARDPEAMTALSTLLASIIPSVKGLSEIRAKEAGTLLAEIAGGEGLSTSTVRSLVKCVGLLARACDRSSWGSIGPLCKSLLSFSLDKRPKVRKSALMFVEEAFKSFDSSSVTKKASKEVLSLFEHHRLLARDLIQSDTFRTSEKEEKHKILEVLHMLNALKLIIPLLSGKVISKFLLELNVLLVDRFTPITRHLFDVLDAIFTSRSETFASETKHTLDSLASYICSIKKNPINTVITASSLLRSGLSKLNVVEPQVEISKLPQVFSSVAGKLSGPDENVSMKAAEIVRELAGLIVNQSSFLGEVNLTTDKEALNQKESTTLKSLCSAIESVLDACAGPPNIPTLAVVSDLFIMLAESSFIWMKAILIKLSKFEKSTDKDAPCKMQLDACIGCAVVAMGPEMILSITPLTLDEEKLSFSNQWLIPILKKYTIGASLRFFVEHIVPLANSLQKISHKAPKSSLVQELQSYTHCLWDLLPSFCNYPVDTDQSFTMLATLMLDALNQNPNIHQIIALALLKLVNQNKDILNAIHKANDSQSQSISFISDDFHMEVRRVKLLYTKKRASKNIKALSSFSVDLIEAFSSLLFRSTHAENTCLKDVIGCLASITDGSKVNKIFVQSVQKFQLTDGAEDNNSSIVSITKPIHKESGEDVPSKRLKVLQLAYSLVGGADEDGVNMIIDHVKSALEADNELCQHEAFCVLGKLLKEHTWFCSTRLDELIELLLGAKPSAAAQKSHFACFHHILVYLLENNLENMSTRALLILNQIIQSLKDSNKEARKLAYDVLLQTSCSLRSCSSGDPIQRLFSMIMGCLAGTTPRVMSASVAALSWLIYENPSVCFSVPDLLPSVLALLQSKAREVIKAVLGFVKVLVTCLQAKDLKMPLLDIVNGVLPWSSDSKNHFKSKVWIILEILIRKCGFGSVRSVTPDKYKETLKSIIEQRQGKTNSKVVSIPSDSSKPINSTPERGPKRTREKDGFSRKERNGSWAPGVKEKGKTHKRFKQSNSELNNSSLSAHNDNQKGWRNKMTQTLKDQSQVKRQKHDRGGGKNSRGKHLNGRLDRGNHVKHRPQKNGKHLVQAAPQFKRDNASSKVQKKSGLQKTSNPMGKES
ncbi:hypothetical protein AMTRI_Chr01g135660 [Amborella trichopoda]